MPSVAVVVPAFNAAATVGGALRSLLAQRPAPPGRILVVDDGSTDGTAWVASGLDPRIEVLRRPTVGGEAAALNTGFEACREDFVGIVEADVVVAPDWLALLTGTLASTGAAGAGGALRPFPGAPWPARLAGYEVQARQESQRGRPVLHVSSANALYARRAWELAGPFREDLMNASLDSDFNARLLQAGERLAWEPRATAWHHYKPGVSGFLLRTLAYARTRWRVPNLALYPGDRELVPLLVLDALAWSALAWGAWAPPWAVAAWTAAFGGHVPLAWDVLRRRRDPAAVLMPFLLTLRGGVAVAGLALGLLEEPVRP